MFDYIEKLRTKPGHIRERVAFGVAAGTTTLVFAGWLAVMTATNAFSATGPTQYAAAGDAQAPIGSVFNQTASSFSSFFGAQPTQPANIVVETDASTTVDQPAPTVIPF